MELKIVSLPQMQLAASLARECVALQCLGAISGPPGTGKTTALQAMESMPPGVDSQGNCHYLRASSGEGVNRALRDLIESFDYRPGSLPTNMSQPYLIALLLKEMSQRKISLLAVDEADAWSKEALRGFVSLYDGAQRKRQPFGAVLAGSSQLVGWLSGFAAALSRTLRCEEFQNLDPQGSLALLREWFPCFERLAGSLKDKAARKCVDLIYKATSGNPRRLSFFARLHELHFPGAEVTEETVRGVSALLLNEGLR